jgi:hypothetical protein
VKKILLLCSLLVLIVLFPRTFLECEGKLKFTHHKNTNFQNENAAYSSQPHLYPPPPPPVARTFSAPGSAHTGCYYRDRPRHRLGNRRGKAASSECCSYLRLLYQAQRKTTQSEGTMDRCIALWENISLGKPFSHFVTTQRGR